MKNTHFGVPFSIIVKCKAVRSLYYGNKFNSQKCKVKCLYIRILTKR